MGFAALLLWLIVVVVLFRRVSLQTALVVSIVGGYLLLPSERQVYIDLPLLPAFDKVLLPALTALIMAWAATRTRIVEILRARRRSADTTLAPIPVQPGYLPKSWLGRILLVMLVAGAAMTVLTNGDRLVFGVRVMAPLRPYDAFSAILTAVVMLLPFFLGRKYLSDESGHRTLLIVIGISAFAYSFLALYEVRMSPQINRMVYGFFPHSWIQHVRGGGFRPLVFLNHGLNLGIFLACAIIAATTMMRVTDNARHRLLWGLAMLWLLGTLFLAKTLGAFVIAIVLLPVALFFGRRQQLLVVIAISAVTLSYPILRGAGIVPTDAIVEQFNRIDTSRAGSLLYRFDNEDLLLARANERPAFGWGGNARSRVFDEQGRDIATADGSWVIMIGVGGWVTYIATFGLLCLPPALLAMKIRRRKVSLATSGLCLMVAANLVDLLPNSGLSPVLWLAAGAIIGRLETEAAAPDPEVLMKKKLPYTRFSQPGDTRPVRVDITPGVIRAKTRAK